MPNYDKTAEQIEAETDRILLEQAKAFIRGLRATTNNAPYGKIVNRAEIVAVHQGREFTRLALETIVQEQNDLLEKKRNKTVPLWRRSGTPRIHQQTNRKCCRHHRDRTHLQTVQVVSG